VLLQETVVLLRSEQVPLLVMDLAVLYLLLSEQHQLVLAAVLL
jgi:hypothetical protein